MICRRLFLLAGLVWLAAGAARAATPAPAPPVTPPASPTASPTVTPTALPLASPSPGEPPQEVYRCVCRVNEIPISQLHVEGLAQKLAPTWPGHSQPELLQLSLGIQIKQVLIQQLVRRSGVPHHAALVEKLYERAGPRDGNSGPQALDQFDQYQSTLEYDQALGEGALAPSPAEIRAYYDENLRDFIGPTAVKLRAIIIHGGLRDDPGTPETEALDARELAERVVARARADPAQFKELVRQYSDDPAHAGLYRYAMELSLEDAWQQDWWPRNSLPPALRPAAEAEEGSIVGPLTYETGAGATHFVFKVEQRIVESLWPFELVAPAISRLLQARASMALRQQRTEKLFHQARIEGGVQVLQQVLQITPPDSGAPATGATGGTP